MGKTIRVSDIISIDDVRSWNKDKIILINAGTGLGKTSFIKNILIEYCRENNKTILFLVNRTALKEQTNRDIKKQKRDCNNIMLASYQAVTRKLFWNKKNPDKIKAIAYYDFIVCDETHWFFSDALFNNTTDLMWEWLMNSSSIKVLMTATATLPKKYIKEVLQKKIKEYPLQTDYNQFIETIYMYNNDEAIEQILFNLPEGEKAIYFCGAEKAHKISKLLPDAKFYCSKANDKLYKYADIETYENIVNNSKFDCQVLCTTSVLDNGVNFIDPTIKYIIIDYIDLDEIHSLLAEKES
jgi:superfamily II DNA or RNA helicase